MITMAFIIFIKGLFLFLLAWLLFLPFAIINFFVVCDPKGYFMSSAVNLDKYANREFRSLWNKTLRVDGGYKFGYWNETLSSALGKNKRDGTLTKAGVLVCKFLHLLDRNHVEKSIKEF
jgi:hypothetical protein